jgi:hypothetical protein
MSRTLIGLLMIGLLGACGSGDTNDPTTTTAGTVPETVPETTGAETTETTGPMTGSTEAAPSTPETTTTEESSDTVAESAATISIGADTYEFRTTGFAAETCDPDFFGGVQVVLAPADENGEPLVFEGVISPLTMILLPSDLADDAPSVEFRVPGGDVEWFANADSTTVSGSEVGEWSVEGNRVTGAATFVSDAGDGPVAGTFEVVCADE